ncbi:MAG: AAA family ATPase, partial [Chloroflexota bacterium]
MAHSDYEFEEILYEGEEVQVYRGRYIPDNQRVILKIVKDKQPPSDQIANLKQEYQTLQTIWARQNELKDTSQTDSLIIQPYGLEQLQGRWVMVLEDFGGESLTRLDLVGEMTVSGFLALALQITEAVAELNHHQFVHQHLTLDNIVANLQTKQVKLIDFGLAAPFSSAVTPNPIAGTLAYLAPEQTGRVQQPIDARTDLYGLGIVFYELLTGHVPFVATDLLALFYSHLAQQPKPLNKMDSSLPAVLSDIILKLLAKDPIERYQTAAGLKSDLSECLRQWSVTGTISHFSLGQGDYEMHLHIPEKLYGRERTMSSLVTVFDRACTGNRELMLVSGPAGVGKSAIINRLEDVVLRRGGYFVAGKFDQRQGNVPYSAVGQALQRLIQSILMTSPRDIQRWQEKIQDSLSPNGQLLIDLVPDLEQIIGAQPILPPLNPIEAQNRFQLVFQKFIALFAQESHPLVIFLDDLQWADVSSLQLWQRIATEADLTHLLLIGAYRNEEIDASHPLSTVLTHFEQIDFPIQQIELAALDSEQLDQLVQETLVCSQDQIQPLVAIILERTQGNPFFVRQFLYWLTQQALLQFDLSQNCWQWDLGQIRSTGLTENIIDLISSKLATLPEKTL